MTKELALASAKEVAEYLKREHGATRVLLFGSAVHGEFFEPHSDIDLYFEGVPYEKECLITGKTFCQFSSLDLDLMAAGHATDALKKEVMATGVEL